MQPEKTNERRLPPLLEHNGRRNIYFIPNQTTPSLNKKPSKNEIEHVEFIHADLDPRKDETPRFGPPL